MVKDCNGVEVKDLVSIIIPVYNVERYLEKCLDAVCSQTYPYLEIILIDNVSTDSSLDIAKRYAKRDDRIRLITKESHKTAGHSRNLGLRAANGKYIAFVDSDDYPEIHFIEKMLQTLLEHDVNIVQCCYKSFDDFGNQSDYLNYQEDRCYSGRELCKFMQEFVGLCGPNTMVWNKIYRAEILKEVSFYEGHIYEDMFLTYKILYPQEKVIWIADRLMNWRKNVQSGTSKYNYREDYISELYAYIERCCFFLENHEEELYTLTLKRFYYIAAQHLYLYRKYVTGESKQKIQYWLKDMIRETYPKLKEMQCWSFRTKVRMWYICHFPYLFGRRTIVHHVNMQI